MLAAPGAAFRQNAALSINARKGKKGQTVAQLIAARRARFEAFETDTRVNTVHDISEVNCHIDDRGAAALHRQTQNSSTLDPRHRRHMPVRV
jgi:hypothetical protein